MSNKFREQRRAEILANAMNSVDGRRRRRRAIHATLYASCAVVVGGVAWIMTASRPTERQAPVVKVDDAPHQIKAAPESQPKEAHFEVVSNAQPRGGWLVTSTPLQQKHVVVTSPLRPDQLASDAELSGVLAANGTPGLVRTNGKAFAAFELGAEPPAPAPAHPPGSAIAPPRTHV